MPADKHTHDTLVIHLSPDTSVHKSNGLPWFARMEIKCNLLALMDEGFFLSAAENIDTTMVYVTNENNAATSWKDNRYSCHQIVHLRGPTKRMKLFKHEPEWTGVIHISADSCGALSRCHIDELDHTNIYEVRGSRRGEDGEMKLVYYYLCWGDQNINCVYGDRWVLNGFWAWPREEHVQLSKQNGPEKKETVQDELTKNVGRADQSPSYDAAGPPVAGNNMT